MKTILKTFEAIWKDAAAANVRAPKQRFFKIFSSKKKFVTIGLYDNVTKKWSTFESINLSGNYRYNNRGRIPEMDEMREMVEAAS
jgi:hypothetical protein